MRHPNASKIKLRLFCFPYAGGGASVFRLWSAGLPQGVEVCAVQLPGRENRIAEPLISDIDELVPIACDSLVPYCDTPFAFFGHSVGGLVAFELCRELRRRGVPMPVHLLVSGTRAPHIPEPKPLHQLPEMEFLKELRRFSGTPEAILQSRELMEIFAPVLRADFTLEEAYRYRTESPLDIPISAFGGTTDKEASPELIEAWAAYTIRDFTLEMIEGGHFFLNSASQTLLRSVSLILLNHLQSLHEN